MPEIVTDPSAPAPHPFDERQVLPLPYINVIPDDLHVPINGGYQLDELIGKALTILDAAGMNDTQGKAVKDLLRQTIRRWYADAKHHAETSYRGCVAPIVMLRNIGPGTTNNGTERKTVWLAEGNHAVSVS